MINDDDTDDIWYLMTVAIMPTLFWWGSIYWYDTVLFCVGNTDILQCLQWYCKCLMILDSDTMMTLIYVYINVCRNTSIDND